MFSVDIFKNIEPLSIYLAKPSGEVVCCIDDDIDHDDASLDVSLNQHMELQFSITGNSPAYDSLQEGMYLFVEKIGLFKMKQPSIENDGTKEVKSVSAFSCDVELEDKNCSLSLNMGTLESQEYLVSYDDDETESLVNPYTNIPYDWLVIYNTFPEQLRDVVTKYKTRYYGNPDASGKCVVRDTSVIQELTELFSLIPRLVSKITETEDENGIKNCILTEYVSITYNTSGEQITSITLLPDFLQRAEYLISFYAKYRQQLSLLSVVLESTDGTWTVGDIYGVANGDYSLANRKYQFESDETVYSFLTHSLAEASNCIVSFDILNRKVNMTPIDMFGNDTGIALSYENLVNSLNVSCDDETLTTRLYVNGGEELSIRQVNFGLDYIDDLTYKMNARDGNGKRIYVSDALAEKYMRFSEYRESQREKYIELSKEYRRYDEQISELKYRVPNDSLKTDWGAFSKAELEESLVTYKNLLAALVSLYKEDYGTAGLNTDGGVKESYIKNTMYWHDYTAYKNTIVEIECALHTYPYYSDQDKWTEPNISQYKDAVKKWETEWTLYGIVELQAKIDAYTANMNILAEQSVIRKSKDSDEIKTWNELSAAEKGEFGYLESNYYYDAYMNDFKLREGAKTYLTKLQGELDKCEKGKSECQKKRSSIADSVSVKNYFTEVELKELNLLYRDAAYSNENILTTSIDSSSETIDRMKELLDDGAEKLSSLCRPQLTFSVDSDNFLGLADFKPFWNDFLIGNYILVQYKDDVYVKLRMVGFQFNPCLPSSDDFSITFSNFIRSKTKVSDLESLLGLSSSDSISTVSGGSGSGSDSEYGESNDIDVTISNTMLSKLLSSESFGTRVTNIILDTVDANSITAKYAKFEGLAKGTTTIDGKCITTGYIVDQVYNGLNGNIANSKGTVLNLETGQFNFGGGKLVYDGNSLSIKGAVTAESGSIGGIDGFVIASGKLYSNGHSAYNTAKDGVYIGTDYISLGRGGTTYFKNDGTGKIGAWSINSTAIYRGVPSFGASGGMYFGTDGLSVSDVFKVDSSGNTSITDKFKVTSGGALTAISATITGNITATSLTATQQGNIAGWQINNACIYRGSSAFGNISGMYFGAGGLSITDKFKVTSSGSFDFGNGKIVFDGDTLTFGAGVSLSWNQISGADDKVTQITKDTVTTEYINAKNITAGNVAAENITGTTIIGKTLSGGAISGGTITIGNNFKVDAAGNMSCSNATITGKITASLFKYADADVECGMEDGGFYIRNKSATYINSYKIYGKSGGSSMELTCDSLNFYTGGNFNKRWGTLSHDEAGFHFDRSICIETACIRGGENEAPIVNCGESNNVLYFGVGKDGSSEPNAIETTVLRGNTVRIYSHSKKGGAVYLGESGTIAVASDENLKDLTEIDERYEKFFYNLKPTLYKYKLGHRQHIGFGARAVEDALYKSGLSTEDFAGILIDRDVNVGDDEILDENGTKHFDELYSLRYEEFVSLNTLMLQRALSRIKELEKTIEEMKGR